MTKVNPAFRLNGLNAADPHRGFTYAAIVEVDDAEAAERRIHKALTTRRAQGEWFRVHTKLAVALAEHLRKGSPCE